MALRVIHIGSDVLCGADITAGRLLLEYVRSRNLTAFGLGVSELGDPYLLSSECWLVELQAFMLITYMAWASSSVAVPGTSLGRGRSRLRLSSSLSQKLGEI